MGVGAREGFAYHAPKLVLLANGDRRYGVEPNTNFQVVNPSILLEYCPVITLTFVWHEFVSVVYWYVHLRSLMYVCLPKTCIFTKFERRFFCYRLILEFP